jgi:hypothetical protein
MPSWRYTDAFSNSRVVPREFLDLSAGNHKISVTLQTDQTMDVLVKLSLSSQTQTVEVSDRAPVLDTPIVAPS